MFRSCTCALLIRIHTTLNDVLGAARSRMRHFGALHAQTAISPLHCASPMRQAFAPTKTCCLRACCVASMRCA
eukprot:5643857-Pleurochrysis_carterae.AAC.1